MEKGDDFPVAYDFIVDLRQTGQCRIPFRREGQENTAFVDLMDQTAEYVKQLADQQGLKIVTNCSYAEDIGHHLAVRMVE